MLTKAEIKRIKSLQDKKFRDALGLFVVEGQKMVEEALASDYEVTGVYRVEEEGEELMSRISGLSTPPPVIAVVRKPSFVSDGRSIAAKADSTPKETLESPDPGLCLALDAVRDPGNMGTIIRTADWFGVRTIYVSPDSVDIFNPKVIQSTMGSIFRCRIVTADIPAVCREFRSQGLPVYGTLLDGHDIYSSQLQHSGLIVMGNESNGISSATAAELTHKLLIPKAEGSRAESLNVAVATAVTLSIFAQKASPSPKGR